MISLHGTSERDRKSTRLNSSHRCISYAVFFLKKNRTEFTDQMFWAVDWRRYRGLGFTSTLRATVACLPTARRLSYLYPVFFFLFGGPPMESHLLPPPAPPNS